MITGIYRVDRRPQSSGVGWGDQGKVGLLPGARSGIQEDLDGLGHPVISVGSIARDYLHAPLVFWEHGFFRVGGWVVEMPGFRRKTRKMAIGRPAIAREGAVLKPVGVVLRSFHTMRIFDGMFTESRVRDSVNANLDRVVGIPVVAQHSANYLLIQRTVWSFRDLR